MAEQTVEIDLESLSQKLAALELSESERLALHVILERASDSDADVSGFGWDEGVAAFIFPAGDGWVKAEPSRLAHAMGHKLEPGASHIFYPCGLP